MSALEVSYFSPEEYLAIEREAPTKSEYLDGQIFAMAGASRNHNLISLDVSGEILRQLKGRDCEVYASDMRVKVPATGLYTYPDVFAACGPLEYDDAKRDTITNPAVIIEVLSVSTEKYDRGAKFGHYRQLPSLQDYVMIAQNKVSVEHYKRQGDLWILTLLSRLNAVLVLESIECSILLRDIYDRVDFSPGEGAVEKS